MMVSIDKRVIRGFIAPNQSLTTSNSLNGKKESLKSSCSRMVNATNVVNGSYPVVQVFCCGRTLSIWDHPFDSCCHQHSLKLTHLRRAIDDYKRLGIIALGASTQQLPTFKYSP